SGTQFDVYFRMSAADPFAASIQCPIDQITNCFFTTGLAPATLTGDYSLLPGVLHAYAASAQDLAGYVMPVPEPGSMLLVGLGLAALGAQGARRRSLAS
ncbi:MAG TPA: PEP-CTERM sorting domain-containing protein, partial [Burkholderiaceae bacterium]|nr:PEP-CTERM sorting domain-containing protein [Burkholderiaceae bacterium]